MKNLLGISFLLFTSAITTAPQTATPQFEVASVKTNISGSQDSGMSTGMGGRFTATNATLKRLIQFAYNLENFQVTSGPNWLETARFDIAAKAESPANSEDGIRLMVQSLLADRFQLKVHRESRESTVYALVVVRTGPKLTVSTSDANNLGIGRTQINGIAMTMPLLASALSSILKQTVVDKTALTGKFDLNLKWTPDPTQDTISAAGGAPVDPAGPSIFTALQEQLGLRLETQKGSVEVLVIDRAEKPADQ